MNRSRFITACLCAIVLLSNANGADTGKRNRFTTLDKGLSRLVTTEALTGAQVTIMKRGEILFAGNYGNIANTSDSKVDANTRFLIASCSKPFASALTLSLVADEKESVTLSDTVDRWIPQYPGAKIDNGSSTTRAPTISELLSHTGGIYSQKQKLTPKQTRLIRDFRQTLEQATLGIASVPLIAEPGTRFAYSGAGYCILGRAMEIAAKQPIETILQNRICKPLDLQHTSFFPGRSGSTENIATGVIPRSAPHRLGKTHRFPLVGGSIYSTSKEMAIFANAISESWNGRSNKLALPQGLVQELGKRRSSESSYTLGWSMAKDGEITRLSHSGSLMAYKAWIAVELEPGISMAACWTLREQGTKPPVIPLLKQSFEKIGSSNE